MNLTISADAIPTVIRTSFRSKRSPLFVGPPGIGKTDLVNAAADQLSRAIGKPVACYTLHLASMSEVDLRGYLIIDGDRSRFTKPSFWHAVEAHEYGILFVDEFKQATHEMQKAAAQLLQERRIGEWALPPGWIVVGASNRASDNAGTNSLLSHVVNRLCIIEVTPPDVDSWVHWAANNQLAPEVIAFARLRPDIVFSSAPPEADDEPYITARSLHAASDTMLAFDGGPAACINSPIGMAMVAGSIGRGPASELAALVNMASTLPTYEEIITRPEQVPVPEKPDMAYAALMLAAVRAKPEHLEQVATYITRFNPNFVLVGLTAFVGRHNEAAATQAVARWVSDNRQLMAKLSKYIRYV